MDVSGEARRRGENFQDLHLKIIDFTKEIVQIIPQNQKKILAPSAPIRGIFAGSPDNAGIFSGPPDNGGILGYPTIAMVGFYTKFSAPDLRILTTDGCSHHQINEFSRPLDVLTTRSSNSHYQTRFSPPDVWTLTERCSWEFEDLVVRTAFSSENSKIS